MSNYYFVQKVLQSGPHRLSRDPIQGKSEYGELSHAKKAAQKLTKKKLTWKADDRNGGRGYFDVFYGKDKTGNTLFTVSEQMRKTNPERITAAWLKKRVGLLNDMLDRPTTAYTKKADGGLTGNRGHLFIDNAYGGVKVAEMSGGGTGENNISDGYVPKKELNNFINGMIAGVREAQAGRKQNPTHKKTPGYSAGFKLGKKKKGRKKNPIIKQGMQLPGGRGRVMQYDSATDYVLVDRGVGVQPFVVWTIDPVSLDTYTGHYFKNLGDAVRKFEEKAGMKMNPKGRKKMAKKKRSAKQLANDKRLGRMAKARAKVKRGGARKKVARKKVAKRKTNPKTNKARTWKIGTSSKKYYVIVALVPASSGKVLRFYSGFGWVLLSKAAHYADKTTAKKVAMGLSKRNIAVAPSTTSARKLIEVLSGK